MTSAPAAPTHRQPSSEARHGYDIVEDVEDIVEHEEDRCERVVLRS